MFLLIDLVDRTHKSVLSGPPLLTWQSSGLSYVFTLVMYERSLLVSYTNTKITRLVTHIRDLFEYL